MRVAFLLCENAKTRFRNTFWRKNVQSLTFATSVLLELIPSEQEWKTEVAKIMGKIFSQLGILSKNKSEFDRIKILSQIKPKLILKAKDIINNLRPDKF